MIEMMKGDILSDDAEALVNTVNCVGIMGRGIALQFKKAFPDNFKAYEKACNQGVVQPGHMFVYETGQLTSPRLIINFPTKRHWRGKSLMGDIEAGLEDLVQVLRARQVQSVAIPPLGSGLGGLNWADVKDRIEQALTALADVRVTVYEPDGSSAVRRMAPLAVPPKMTSGRAALVALMNKYLSGLLDPSVSLLEVHKLMYFMQEAGEPLRLRYSKAPYGPYADNLRHVLTAIEGYFVTGYSDGGDDPRKLIGLVPGAVDDSFEFLADEVESRHRLERVADLIEGFESPFGLELLSTVHWVTKELGSTDQEQVVDRLYSWNARKRQFTHRQIGVALNVLSSKGWV